MKSENETTVYSGEHHWDSLNDSEKIEHFLSEKTGSPNKSGESHTIPFNNCLVDYSGRQFACFHDHCKEHKSCFKTEAQNENFDFQAIQFHPDDKALFCGKIFPDIVAYINQIPTVQLCEYRFSFNHRYIRKDGTISQFLQECTMSISDEKKQPVLNLNVFTEIGDFKTDETIILSIFRYTAGQGYQKVNTKIYRDDSAMHLSHREIEIIKLSLEGLSSKMIADRLNLSIHTVKNHKRNCMEKTLTHNIAELIHLCIRSKWL